MTRLDKQAVLLIHGIGEQRPMETLRGFVNAVWTADRAVHHPHSPATVWSKPDTLSGSYELRRLTTGQNRAGIRTDFFEFYWAHMISDTRIAHVTAWARLLLLRWPWSLPRNLVGVWFLLVAAASLVVALVTYNASLPPSGKLVALPGWANAAVGVLGSAFIGFVVLQVIGDAARYLNPAPPNIKQRQEIRAKGIEVLKKLHKKGYRRIVVVGHSLGSVIGYDILTHAWAEFNTGHNSPEAPLVDSLARLERLIREGRATSDDYRKAQRAYLTELAANGNEWRVTDFLTLGSPLTHASILLARNAGQLAAKQADREFPSSPPVMEDGCISYPLAYRIKGGAGDSDERLIEKQLRVPHHAAVFAPTRWTNLYFPARFVVWGDLVGGPLAPSFGPGVQDLAVKTSERLGFLGHTLYWSIPKPDALTGAVRTLRAALDLADDHGKG